MATRKSIPSKRCKLPPVNRVMPVELSTPIMARPSPKQTDIAAFAWFCEPIPPRVQKASRYNAKYSAGPKRNAIPAKTGANSINPMVAKKAPTKDANPDKTKASPARPCFAIGYPSKVVIIAGSSPGIFNNIDDILPPYIAP